MKQTDFDYKELHGAGKGTVRASMQVSTNNTSSLKAKFEQMRVNEENSKPQRPSTIRGPSSSTTNKANTFGGTNSNPNTGFIANQRKGTSTITGLSPQHISNGTKSPSSPNLLASYNPKTNTATSPPNNTTRSTTTTTSSTPSVSNTNNNNTNTNLNNNSTQNSNDATNGTTPRRGTLMGSHKQPSSLSLNPNPNPTPTQTPSSNPVSPRSPPVEIKNTTTPTQQPQQQQQQYQPPQQQYQPPQQQYQPPQQQYQPPQQQYQPPQQQYQPPQQQQYQPPQQQSQPQKTNSGVKAPIQPKLQQPVKGGSGFGDDLREAPLAKPKPDYRKTLIVAPGTLSSSNETPSVVVSKPPQQEPLQTSNETKEEKKNMSSSDLFGDFNVSEKWKINYDELEFDQMVSSGSAGEVFLGYYYGTPVAIKKLFALAPDQKHLVAREFAMLQGVNHPNIVQFLGICDHNTGIYLVTEYVEHGDLFDLLIFGEEDIGWRAKVKIAAQVGTAVFYLHSRNIIHRDLKSQNVLIGESMKVKLCDLGLATITENRKRMTVCGTDEWMAPEIVLAETYDYKVDVFSFGIVLTEMISNQPPKKRGFDDSLRFNVEAFTNSLPSDCPPEFAQLTIDCTKFDPNDRPAFKEIVQRLRKLLESIPEG